MGQRWNTRMEKSIWHKASPDAQLYLQMSQKQTQAMKILVECLPKTEKPMQENDGFDDFLRERMK